MDIVSLGQNTIQWQPWAGRECGSPCATYAGTGGYPKRRTHQIALAKSAAQRSGTKAALTAGFGRRESRWGAAAGRRQAKTDDARTLQAGFTCGAYPLALKLVPR